MLTLSEVIAFIVLGLAFSVIGRIIYRRLSSLDLVDGDGEHL